MQMYSYPAEWSDDDLMAAMFAPFPSCRDVGPSMWDRKIGFWTNLIRRRCLAGRSATFSVKRLAFEFERNGNLPACLGNVVQHLVKYVQYRGVGLRVFF